MSGSNSIFGNFGGQVGQITLDNFRNALNENDEEVLNELAFYIDVNKASSLGSTRVILAVMRTCVPCGRMLP